MDVDSIEEGLAIKKALVEGTTEDEEERPNAREKIKRIKGPNGGREKTEKRRLQREQKRLREGIDKESMRGIRAANPPVSNPFGHWNPKTEAKKRARENKKERGEDEAGGFPDTGYRRAIRQGDRCGKNTTFATKPKLATTH